MKTLLILLTIFLPVSLAWAGGDALAKYKWSNRLIVYSIAESKKEKYNIPKTVRENREGIVDRDMLFLDLNGKDKGELFIEPTPEEIERIRGKYDLSPDKTVFILIGKDGGEKERLETLDLQHFFNKIDQMPMRQQEMSE